MSASKPQEVIDEIAGDFDALANLIEDAIKAFAEDDTGTIDLGALQRAKGLAERGADIARNATGEIRRAFD